jgi:phosphoribosylaminoimidazolecarboxamide formyltransferase/IMP cyclohydrolase
LHPKIHGGLLAVRSDATHESAKKAHDISDIDLLVVNLYPFEETVEKKSDWKTTIENIDVGGPAMIRAAAKNHDRVTVVVSLEDYAIVLSELAAHDGNTTEATRRSLAAKAFARTAAYDAAIAQWFSGELGDTTPSYFATGGKRVQTLRYGENPHQTAALTAARQRKGLRARTDSGRAFL